MDIISRKDAASQNLTHFYTGNPCKHGHDAPRYVSCGVCIPCMNDRTNAYNAQFRRGLIKTTRAPKTSRRLYQFKIEVPGDATEEQRKAFGAYVQHQCVPMFFELLGLSLNPPKSTT